MNTAAAILLCCMLSGPLGGRRQDPDDAAAGARIESALRATGFSCNKSASGKNWTIAFGHPDQRHQTVWVTATPAHVGPVLVHRIYTTVWIGKERPDDALVRRVFARCKKAGAFYLFCDSGGQWLIRFAVDFDATDLPAESHAGDQKAQQLADLLRFVDAVGDETDHELNGTGDVR